ncbi:MAG: DNA phosphorothioation-associated DGQHR protein 1 [Saprospiraceae bacterium]
MDNRNFKELLVLKVSQPLGDFYAASIPVKDLLEITFTEPLKYIDKSGKLVGGQRQKDDKRLKEIGKYIETPEMAFPNSIILAANFTEAGNILKDYEERWRIEQDKSGQFKLIIPKKLKLAAIIDGQHRLGAFKEISDASILEKTELLCSIYFDLTNSYQAYLFATINSNQKKVDRSLALEQFGYNVDDEDSKAWSPEKLSVFLTRKLNVDNENSSPFYNHIKVAALNGDILFDGNTSDWYISTATVVDGICALLSSNPKRDRILMLKAKNFFTGRSRDLIRDEKDYSPLRSFYLNNNDLEIYNTVLNYFKAISQILWSKKSENSYITKTVGVQASFDILKLILNKEKHLNPSKINFDDYINMASSINFSDKFFQASGIGRSRIKKCISLSMGLVDFAKIRINDREIYNLLIDGKNSGRQNEYKIGEEEAENAVMFALETAIWNYDSKSVSLFINDNYEEPVIFQNFKDLIEKLIELFNETLINNMPDDVNFVNDEKNDINSKNIVLSNLVDYGENFNRLGWYDNVKNNDLLDLD